MSDTQSQHKYTNRLINETSPYLLQHAHNPVDWYPWGEEALRKAKEEDKPILLSVGYSACHWCHVMERESFENPEIAALMNQHFVSIKVDREERPDVDSIYMQAVQALTQQGGWPMTVFLTPDGRPFYGGTYYPPHDRHYGRQVMPGFPRILLSMASAYQTRRQDVEEQASQLAEYLNRRSNAPLHSEEHKFAASDPLQMFKPACQELAADFDSIYGGFGGAPKFPNTMVLEFLLRMHLHRQKGELDTQSVLKKHSELDIVELSLQRMAYGGIYDQLGGGFHRYSVDAEWQVPHFEKMLYDNALLSRLYLHAYLVTNKPLYRRVVEETLDYVIREMTSPEGGFYSTQDADSEGEEGKFFTWTVEEIKALLPVEDAPSFMQYYGVSEHGNFEGKNILHIQQTAQKVADDAQISLDELQAMLKRDREMLFKAREQRIKPGRDEKILTSWNGLMLRSFAEAARYLSRPDYLQVAINNANFLLRELRPAGRLLRTYKDGRAHLNGYLEDYVYLADGLLALYEASLDPQWFSQARQLMDQALDLFADRQNGGFFDTGNDHEALLSRPKDIMDNATPAGNSVAIGVLLRLAAFTGYIEYREYAEKYLQALAELMIQHPQAFGHVLGALDFALSQSQEIAIVGDAESPEARALLECVNSRYLPNSVLACAAPENREVVSAIPLLQDRPLKNGKATAYVCQQFACQEPVNTAEDLKHLL
ncbi:thioredoxin domain-containing protein [Ktedonosporobacter rubrisoli]|uniref:Thioredoxin domain-containing protein n=1 Tax=Ktedonosporobacter rubrisoli TaxID=2509675 RepID=A0A4V0YZZ4_KTERU|nr:thioredoxin domain-containing protein [Ktedonosporobacter rubrisoli]QBD81431.1 thioredoxin domain-containing protein [Ktedonosporobacter rubrisoli]